MTTMDVLISRVMAVATLAAIVACSSSADAPAGSCRTGGTATGSFVASCNQCALDNCDQELKEKAGSGWSMQSFGGDGACAAFNGCICGCLSKGGDPVTCSISAACLTKADAACRTAVGAAQVCLNQHCSGVCR
jgi:hypothetical protein